MVITHGYTGLGDVYQKYRKGIPEFASIMISDAGFGEYTQGSSFIIVELGAGSGQQTEYLEKELSAVGISKFVIHAYDKSRRIHAEDPPGQLDMLHSRISEGELSSRIIPVLHNFDECRLPEKTGSIELVYMAHVLHHVTNKSGLLREIRRVLKQGGRFHNLGVTLEDLRNHPLNEFFPTKLNYETGRYPTECQLRQMFLRTRLTWEPPVTFTRETTRKIDEVFLESIENTTLDSALFLMKNDDPMAFRDGVSRIRAEVERAEKTGQFRTYAPRSTRIFRGYRNT